jgi:hypothetical protein
VVRLLWPRCPEWAARPTTVVSSGVLVGLGGVCVVATPWLVREPRGWGFRGCGGGGWGAAVWWAASWAQARGQLATETCTPGQCQWHAAARMPFKPDTASFRAVRCVVGGKEAKFSRSDVASASNLRNPLQMRMPSMHVSATVDCCHVAEQIAGNPCIEVRKMVSLCNSWKKPFLRRTQGWCDAGLTAE